jgi:hypothetical protein
MISAAVALAISGLSGWFAVGGLWRDPIRSLGLIALRLAVSMGIGLLLHSFAYFGCLVAGLTQRPYVVSLDLAVLAASYYFYRSRSDSQIQNRDQRSRLGLAELNDVAALGSMTRRGIFACLSIALLFNALVWRQRFADEPMGFWDAFTIWNLKARFFFLDGGAHWQRAFHSAIDWSHTDYPLLIPLEVARLWTYGGNANAAIPALLSACFTVLAILSVFASVAVTRGLVSATLAALVLLAAPEFMGQGMWQVADIPAGFLLATSLGLLLIGFREANPTLYRLAGVMAGAAAWTKNEGSLMALSILVGILCLGQGARLKDRARPAAHYLAGLALPLLCVIATKTTLGGESDLAADYGPESLLRIFDLARHQAIIASFTRSALFVAGLPVIAVLAGLWLYLQHDRKSQLNGIGALGLALSLQLAGYYCVYLITDRDLAWHLGTSNLRIFVQLFPGATLLFFTTMPPISLPNSLPPSQLK